MVILAVAFVVWKWRQNQNSKSVINLHTLPLSFSILHCFFLCFTTGNNIATLTTTTTSNNIELPLLIEEKIETQIIAESTKLKDLDEKKANLNEQLKEVEEEHKDAVGMFNLLMVQKEDVDNQIHYLVSRLHEVKRQVDESQSQPEENNKKYLNKKQEENERLDTETKQIEKKLQETDILSKFIFCGITIVREKKEVLDNLKVQINTQLEEVEKERDKMQKTLKSDHSET